MCLIKLSIKLLLMRKCLFHHLNFEVVFFFAFIYPELVLHIVNGAYTVDCASLPIDLHWNGFREKELSL